MTPLTKKDLEARISLIITQLMVIENTHSFASKRGDCFWYARLWAQWYELKDESVMLHEKLLL